MSQNSGAESVLRAQDPDLPFLATRAAIELDTLLANTPTQLEAVQKLAESLRNATQAIEGSGQRRLLMDPPTVNVFNRALLSIEKSPVANIDDLANRSLQMADEMKNAHAGMLDESITRIRDFCVALSRNASAYRESILDLQPSHPLRS